MNLLLETYHLVHDLSKNEKGYFKRVNTSNKKASKLIRAFDIILSHEEFDRWTLQSHLDEENIAKNVLRDLVESILKSLSLFNAGNSSTFKLNLLLSQVESLFNKKRYTLCHSYVEKGIRLAGLRGQETYALQFSFWKRRLEGLLAIPMTDDLEDWARADDKHLKLVEDRSRLHHLGGVQTRILMSNITSEDVVTDLEEKVLNAPILKSEYEEESLENLFLHNGIKIRCQLIAGDLESALQECLTLFDKIRDQKLEGRMLSNYFVLRLNIMRVQAFLGHHENYTSNRIALEKTLKSSLYLDNIKALKSVVYPSFPVIHCAYLASKGETEYLVNYYQAFIQNPVFVTTVDGLTEIEIGLLHAWSLFVSKKHTDCFHRVSKLNVDFNMSDFQRLNSLSKWLELLACYEMRDESLFQSRSKSLQHYIQIKTQSSEVERSLLKHLNSSFSVENRRAEFQNLIADGTMDFKKLRMAFSFMDVHAWIIESARDKRLTDN